MKYILLLVTSVYFNFHGLTQQDLNTDHILELSSYYSSYMFGSSEVPKDVVAQLGTQHEENLVRSASFVKEVTKPNNKILSVQFLKLPDTTTLKVVYIIDALHQNPHLKNPKDPKALVDSLKLVNIPYFLLVDQYYQTVFTSVGNKNRPFDLSKYNFQMAQLGLNSSLLKGVFFLRCMDMCVSQIFGYMNIVKPPNTQKALSYIEKFPKFNGQKYYQYADFQFDDFEMQIFNDKEPESYKRYFINQYYTVMMSHAVCLKKEKSVEDFQAFFGESTLKEESLWKFTDYEEILRSILKGK